MRFLLVIASALWLVACAQPAAADTVAGAAAEQQHDYVEGRDYRLLEQPLAGAPDVIELFFYGCRACYYLTDEMSGWSAGKGIQVNLVPAHSDTNLIDSARMFHTFGVLNRLDLHVDGYVLFQESNDLQGDERINALLAERGVDKDEFWAAWGSDEVNQRLAGSYQLTAMAGISSTPAFLVKGKYLVELGVIEGSEGVLSLLGYLVELDA